MPLQAKKSPTGVNQFFASFLGAEFLAGRDPTINPFNLEVLMRTRSTKVAFSSALNTCKRNPRTSRKAVNNECVLM